MECFHCLAGLAGWCFNSGKNETDLAPGLAWSLHFHQQKPPGGRVGGIDEKTIRKKTSGPWQLLVEDN